MHEEPAAAIRSREDGHRIAVLDGLRGVAIAMVLIYHYFGRWTSSYGQPLYPYRDAFADWPIAHDGFVGVFLFFIISGYVISKSLQSSSSIMKFAAKRADRLVLPMLVLSTVTFVVLTGPLETPFFKVIPADFLPSWTFTAPQAWQWLAPDVDYIDGVYWTLFVELRFYFVFAVFWFAFSRKKTEYLISAFAIVGLVLYSVLLALDEKTLSLLAEIVFFPQYSCLFAAGVIYFRMMSGQTDNSLRALLGVVGAFSLLGAVLGGVSIDYAPAIVFWCALFHFVFVSLVLRKAWVDIFALRGIVAIGALSYSLYLIHQRFGVAIIHRIPADWPLAVQLFCVALVALLMIGIAYASSRFIERQRVFSKTLMPAIQRIYVGRQAARHSPGPT